MIIDIFCQVIDFAGDVAVSWRLATAIKLIRPSWTIRYYCDDLTLLNQLVDSSIQLNSGIAIFPYLQTEYLSANIVIEALSCQLPQHYTSASYTISWEYLTTESFSFELHLKQSYPFARFFFMPGVYHGTGGLTFGTFTHHPINIMQQKIQLAHKWNLPAACIYKPWVSSYLYQGEILCSGDIFLIGPPWDHNHKKHATNHQSMTLQDYDLLLQCCDAHLVRGEDSLSRALLSGKPFLWQAYQQTEQSHHIKIQALIDYLCSFTPALYPKSLINQDFWHINTADTFDISTWIKHWQVLIPIFHKQCEHLVSIGSQEQHMVQFIEQLTI